MDFVNDPVASTPGSALDRCVVVQTCRVLLRPIASQECGLNGRPTNVSRVPILSGVSRNEITRVRAQLEQQAEPAPNKTTDATRLLSGWHQARAGPGAPRKQMRLGLGVFLIAGE